MGAMVAVAVRAVPAGTADRVAPAAAEVNSRPWGQGGRAGGYWGAGREAVTAAEATAAVLMAAAKVGGLVGAARVRAAAVRVVVAMVAVREVAMVEAVRAGGVMEGAAREVVAMAAATAAED